MNAIDKPLENSTNAVDVSRAGILWTWVIHMLNVRDNMHNDLLLAQLNSKLGISGLVRALIQATFFLKSAFVSLMPHTEWCAPLYLSRIHCKEKKNRCSLNPPRLFQMNWTATSLHTANHGPANPISSPAQWAAASTRGSADASIMTEVQRAG